MKIYSFLSTAFLTLILNGLVITPLAAHPHMIDILDGDLPVVSKTESNLEINVSAGAILVFDDFTIQEDETVNIVLPTSEDNIYLKVKSKTSTKILGQLNCNGGIYLINPYGIDIESNSQITAANISIKGKYIVHQGVVKAEKVDGTISTIVFTADSIVLKQHSVINASGINGGGHIYIGGGWKGNDHAIPNALEVVVEENAFILADAVHNGSGGFIVVWSERLTKFFGNLSAIGRGSQAQGGLAEIASKTNLEYNGNAILNADNGSLGTLLLQ